MPDGGFRVRAESIVISEGNGGGSGSFIPIFCRAKFGKAIKKKQRLRALPVADGCGLLSRHNHRFTLDRFPNGINAPLVHRSIPSANILGQNLMEFRRQSNSDRSAFDSWLAFHRLESSDYAGRFDTFGHMEKTTISCDITSLHSPYIVASQWGLGLYNRSGSQDRNNCQDGSKMGAAPLPAPVIAAQPKDSQYATATRVQD